MADHTIRLCETLAEYRACLHLQEEVWGAGFGERAPVSLMKVSQRLGGVVAGAWDEEGGLAGFVFGMTGIERGEPVHWSDMLAVRPGLRDEGLGTRLKAFQRETLLQRGIRTAYWTFDPLQARNGHLNLGRLGAVVREYVPDMYGDVDSPLHMGLGTDRFVALWQLGSARVRERMEAALTASDGPAPPLEPDALAAVPAAIEVELIGDMPVPGAVRTGLTDPWLAVPVPESIARMTAWDRGTAVAWRHATRTALMDALARGYEVRELVRTPPVPRYLLVRRQTDPA